jgi:hypothetical protein
MKVFPKLRGWMNSSLFRTLPERTSGAKQAQLWGGSCSTLLSNKQQQKSTLESQQVYFSTSKYSLPERTSGAKQARLWGGSCSTLLSNKQQKKKHSQVWTSTFQYIKHYYDNQLFCVMGTHTHTHTHKQGGLSSLSLELLAKEDSFC